MKFVFDARRFASFRGALGVILYIVVWMCVLCDILMLS